MGRYIPFIIIFLLSGCSAQPSNKSILAVNQVSNKTELVILYAGPLNKYGPSKEVYSVFGENTGCKINVVENNTNGNIFLQVRYNTNNQSKDWYTYNEGDWIPAQVVHCKATSTSTGGDIKLSIK